VPSTADLTHFDATGDDEIHAELREPVGDSLPTPFVPPVMIAVFAG